VSDEARNAILVVTGTNAAVRDIIAPLVNKIYTIKNSTTGGFGIRIIGVTGTGITIPNGYTTTVYCDSTNFNQSLSAVTGNFNVVGNELVGGTLGVTGATALTTGAISGVVTAPTATAGTNTTQLATTAFVTTAVASAFPSGTRVPFAQASAPTGWTQDTSDNANNRMLRVVAGTGNGVGGSASPILNNVVPSHTHTQQGTFGTSTVDINHTHGFSGSYTTNGQSVSHTHGISDPGHAHGISPGAQTEQNVGQRGRNDGLQSAFVNATQAAATGISLGDASVDHTHTVSISGTSATMNSNNTHNHTVTVSGTTAVNGSASDWTPRYIDLIICAKN
jgi:hypothetical protein